MKFNSTKLNAGLCALSLVALLAAAPSAMAANATAGVGATVGATTSDGSASATAGTNGGVTATTDGTNADTSTSTAANGNASSDHGVTALGVDISSAGDTSASVQSFTTNLTTEQQANIATGCKNAMAHPDQASADVVAFCKNSMM